MPFDSTSYLLGAAIVAASTAAALAWSNYRAERAAKAASRPLLLRPLSELRGRARDLMVGQLLVEDQANVGNIMAVAAFLDPMSAGCLTALLATPPGLYGYRDDLVLLESYFENKDGSCTHATVSDAFGQYAADVKVALADLVHLGAPPAPCTAA